MTFSTYNAYTCFVRTKPTRQCQPTPAQLPCACANLRRAARAVTRTYNHELRTTGLEVTQYTLLMALSLADVTTQGKLGRLLALDTTTLTRMLRPLKKRGWIAAQSGDDRRQRLLRLTPSGREKLRQSRPHWERAQDLLRRRLGDRTWSKMGVLLAEVAHVCAPM